MFEARRIYNPPEPDEGFRVLVDRLWPRGLSKAEAGVDEWLRDIAPSDALRKWFAHDPLRWAEFKRRYREELRDKKTQVKALRDLEKEHGRVTLLFAAKDEAHNNARALAEILGRSRPGQVKASKRSLSGEGAQPPGAGR